MTRSRTRILALAAAVAMVSSMLAPAAVGAAAAGNASVTTEEATNVTDTSATLNGNLTALGDASNATVWFEYWPVDDNGTAGNVSATEGNVVNDTGTFSADVELESNTTHRYVAYAEPAGGEPVSGGEVTIERTAEWEDEDRVFGDRVSSFVEELQRLDAQLGTVLSEWVVSNNPGANNRPAHAGPDHDDATGADDSDGDDSDDRGPPEHANNDEGDDTETEDADDSDDAETDDGDDEEEDDDEENEDDDDEDGPPEHANND